MTVGTILEQNFVTGDTDIYIRNNAENIIAEGSWYVDAIQDHVTDEAKSFTYQEDDTLTIDLK